MGLDWKLMQKAVNGETILTPGSLGSSREFNRFNSVVNRNYGDIEVRPPKLQIPTPKLPMHTVAHGM